mgnify:CR=1 FL=1
MFCLSHRPQFYQLFMQKLVDGLILYHGSYCEVRNPQLEKCAKRKDIGKGFYPTTSREQAISFFKTALVKAENGGVIILFVASSAILPAITSYPSISCFTSKKEFFFLEKHCTMNLQNYGGMGLPTLQTCIKKKLMLIN